MFFPWGREKSDEEVRKWGEGAKPCSCAGLCLACSWTIGFPDWDN